MVLARWTFGSRGVVGLAVTGLAMLGFVAVAQAQMSAPAANPHAGHTMPAVPTPAKATNSPANPHAGHTMATAAAGDAASVKEFKAVNDKMHKDMSIAFTGKTDVDFVRGMIPHHQGAIEMAEVQLKYGKDAKIRKLAKDIIKAQKSEIAMMKAWLVKNDKK